MSAPTQSDEHAWLEMSPDEEAELRKAFAEAVAEFERGECIPRDEVLPRYRRAG